MPSFRPLSWALSSSGSNTPPTDSEDSSSSRRRSSKHPRKHSSRRHRSHSGHEKNYHASPLGGNIPIGASSPTTAASSRNVSFASGRSDSMRQTSSRSSDDSSSDGRSVTGSPGSSGTSSAPARMSSRKAGVSSAPTVPQVQSVPIATRPRSQTFTSVPEIRTTPPTPSPISQARRAATIPVGAPHPRSLKQKPPYPETPPPMDERRRSSYIAHPAPPTEALHPALRVCSPNPPSPPRHHVTPQFPTYHPPQGAPPTPTSPTYSPMTSHYPKPPYPLNTTIDPLSPPYSPPTIPHRSPSRNTLINPPKEDPYDFLRLFDTLFLIDDSLSMSTSSRWSHTSSALSHFTSIATHYDTDGIDIAFLNSPITGNNLTSPSQVSSLFSSVSPSGCTPTGTALDRILRPYLSKLEKLGPANVKPLNIVVLTDGAATDDPESVIVDAARRLERVDAPLMQVGISFVQIGEEEGAEEGLRELDDAISGVWGVRDMVDTTMWRCDEGGERGAEVVLKCLLGGVNRRWDRRVLEK